MAMRKLHSGLTTCCLQLSKDPSVNAWERQNQPCYVCVEVYCSSLCVIIVCLWLCVYEAECKVAPESSQIDALNLKHNLLAHN